MRYINLFRIIALRNCSKLVEIGVFDGIHAAQMIAVAQVQNDCVSYVGFDIFQATNEGASEYTKMPASMEIVAYRLATTCADIRLIEGDTRVTLSACLDKISDADFVFIDGGHTHDVVASDWQHIESIMHPGMVVVFDDYYIDPPDEIAGMGCNAVIDGLDRERYKVTALFPIDSFDKSWGKQQIQMVMVEMIGGNDEKTDID